MNHKTIRIAFIGFHFTLAIVVLLQSVWTVKHALNTGGTANHALLTLAIIETLAAIVFMIPRTIRLGGLVLLLVFAVAFSVHLLHGELELGLLVYAAGTLFVVIHGNAFQGKCTTAI